MARNDRIPPEIRKEINRIGPGRYMDPRTGRIYVDSADMDGAFEKMIDDVAAADEKRVKERKLRQEREQPPDEIKELAFQHQVAHGQRLMQRHEDTVGWVSRARARRDHLLKRQAFKQSIGSDLDEEDLIELAELDKALGAQEDTEDDES